jgi:hypothetical protein
VIRTLEELDAIRVVWQKQQWHPNVDFDFFSLIVPMRKEVIRPYVIVVSENRRPVTLIVGRVEEAYL